MPVVDTALTIPPTLLIGGMTYLVEECPRQSPEADGDNLVLGEVSHASLTIFINENQALANKVATLWHEVIHALLEQAGQEQNEGIVNALGYGLARVVRDNPALIEFTQTVNP
jgi:hypothetical protein